MNESFVYLWRDSLKNRYYLGYYSGNKKNYICSSKYMMKEYVARPQDFKRRILKVGAKKEMAVLERQLLQKRKKHLGERYYNLMIPRENSFPILKWTDEMKKARSLAYKGRTFSEEWKRNMSINHKGMSGKSPSEETRRKISIALMGRKLSEKHKRNQSIGFKKWVEKNRIYKAG